MYRQATISVYWSKNIFIEPFYSFHDGFDLATFYNSMFTFNTSIDLGILMFSGHIYRDGALI